MSLYFKERIDEQKKQEEDLLKGEVSFTYPWIITIPPPNANGNNDRVLKFNKNFRTTYLFESELWFMKLTRDKFRIGTFHGFTYDYNDDGPVGFKLWYGSCHLSYNLYYDNDMRFLLYSSPKIQLNNTNKDAFKTPVGFLTRMAEAYDKRKIGKIVIHVELQLPTKYFYQPYEKPLCLNGIVCDSYPSNVENNFRYESFKKSDYVIKCPDGEMPARRLILNLASEFFKKHFKISNKCELAVDHSIDVVKPIVTFLHTRYFQMPKFYDLDYAKRILIAIDYFDPEHISDIRAGVEKSLCQKFITEYHDFDSILQWTSLVSRQTLRCLFDMVATVISNKYYFKWQQTFPENARSFENPLFLDIFGSENSVIFSIIDDIFKKSFLINVIIP